MWHIRQMLDLKAIGRLARLRREELGLTQEDIGAALNVDRSHIANLEAGRFGISLENAVILAKELGVLLDDLVRGLPVDGVPRRREIVDGPEELAFLSIWRKLSRAERLGVIERAAPPAAPARRSRRKR